MPSDESKKGVNILDPKQLLRFAQDTSSEGRRQLAGAVSAFFAEHRLSENEQRLASDILLNLLRQAEIDLRQALAERIAVQENVPYDLVIYLANDEISVARNVLMHSPVLQDVNLLHVIATQGEEHWRAIAERPSLSPLVADRLIDTNDPDTVLRLIDNQRGRLQKGSMKKILKMAALSEYLQAPLLRRPEVDADAAAKIYMVVSHALQEQITERFPMSGAAVERAFASLVQEFTDELEDRSDVSSALLMLAGRLQERGDITPDMMLRTLRRGQVGFFIALFSARTGFAPDVVTRMIRHGGGKAFILVCRSLRMMKSEFASLFLLSRGIRTSDKIVDQRELAMALKYYDVLKDFDVERIIKGWQKDPEQIEH